VDHSTRLYIGTRKGMFRMCSHDGRRSWMIEPPALAGWNVYHAIEDPRDPARIYAAARSEHWGKLLARSEDGGRTWDERNPAPAFDQDDGRSVNAVWFIRPGHADRPGELWAGVEPASLFRSGDWGATWHEVRRLAAHESAQSWQAGGGGLCMHGISLDPGDPDSLIATISAGGAYRSDDGGGTWRPINRGVLMDFVPEELQNDPAGHCVHKLVRSAAEPEWLFQQNHCGPHRSANGGATWETLVDRVPYSFGFAASAHPHERRTVYTAPLASDSVRTFADGALAVWRSRDGGDNWEPLRCGLPQRNAYTSAFRAAMTTDHGDEAGIYLGTSTGQLFFSGDSGDHWEMIADFLPPILSVEAV